MLYRLGGSGALFSVRITYTLLSKGAQQAPSCHQVLVY